VNREKEEELRHESYGSIHFSRRQGDPGRLFGSALNGHGSYITLCISRSTLIRNDLHDRTYSGGFRGDLIEVDMSAAQFAELLTTMNIGNGVPCTISHVNGKAMERPPEIPHETERVRSGFKDKMKTLADDAQKALGEIKKLFEEKKNLTKEDRKIVIGFLEKVVMELGANSPFVLKMFEEATQKVTNAAKAEIDAFVTTNVVNAGLKALLQSAEEPPIPTLPEKTET